MKIEGVEVDAGGSPGRMGGAVANCRPKGRCPAPAFVPVMMQLPGVRLNNPAAREGKPVAVVVGDGGGRGCGKVETPQVFLRSQG